MPVIIPSLAPAHAQQDGEGMPHHQPPQTGPQGYYENPQAYSAPQHHRGSEAFFMQQNRFAPPPQAWHGMPVPMMEPIPPHMMPPPMHPAYMPMPPMYPMAPPPPEPYFIPSEHAFQHPDFSWTHHLVDEYHATKIKMTKLCAALGRDINGELLAQPADTPNLDADKHAELMRQLKDVEVNMASLQERYLKAAENNAKNKFYKKIATKKSHAAATRDRLQINSQARQIAEQAKQIASLEEQQKINTQRLTDALASRDSEFDTLEQKLADAEEQNEILKAELKPAIPASKPAESSKTSAKQTQQRTERNRKNAKAASNKTAQKDKDKIAELQQQLANMKQERDIALAEKRQAEREPEKLRKSQATLQKELDAVKLKLHEKTVYTNYTVLQAENDRRDPKVGAITIKYEQGKKLAALQKKNDDYYDELVELDNDIANLKADVSYQEDKNAAYRAYIQRVNDILDGMSKSPDFSATAKDKIKSTVDKLDVFYAQLMEDVSAKADAYDRGEVASNDDDTPANKATAGDHASDAEHEDEHAVDPEQTRLALVAYDAALDELTNFEPISQRLKLLTL